jgi:hypothetical protein
MDAGLVKVVAGCVLAAHGIGHALGWVPAWGITSFQGVSSRSWALTAVIGDPASRAVAGVLFLVPMVGFLVAAGGLLAGQPWWRGAAVASAAVSLVATALYPTAFPTGSTVGSVAANVTVLVGILALGWGTETAIA